MIAGLTPRALAAWAGTDRLSALPRLIPQLRGRALTRASAPLALFVAGDRVPISLLDDDPLALVASDGDTTRCSVAILPLGRSLLVCDRLDAPMSPELVCWPDDSSYHLAHALPRRRHARWLDLGCGSAFAQLLRPELAEQRCATDLNPHALAMAQLGARLSGVALDTWQGDLSAPWRDCDLVTCNAPIPDGHGGAMWRTAGADFVARALAAAAEALAPDGLCVVHAALDALEPALASLPGDRIVVQYTPDDVRRFGIAWWQPAAPARLVTSRRMLSDDRPHVEYADRDAAVC